MEEHQLKCEKEGKFVEAELAKQRVIKFKKLEEEKLLNETKDRHDEIRAQVEQDQKEELEKFNAQWDNDFYEMNSRFTAQEEAMKEEQQKELQNLIDNLNSNQEENPKPSVELLNLNKILEQLVKKKE